MPWTPSTEFEGMPERPPGFPGGLSFQEVVPGWVGRTPEASVTGSLVAWSRLPWEASEIAGQETEIRQQGGWGFSAYTEGDGSLFSCDQRGKKYATREVSDSASRAVSSGACVGQIDRVYEATGFSQTYDWEFETIEDDPETEEVDETEFNVLLETERSGTFTLQINDWEVDGASCNFAEGEPEDADPPFHTATASSTSASFTFSSGGGYTASGTLTYALSDEVTTDTMIDLLTDWMMQSSEFKTATATGSDIFETESTDATFGEVGRGRVRFPLRTDIPEGVTAEVDVVIRELRPRDQDTLKLAHDFWNDGTGSITLSEEVTTSKDRIGEWTTGTLTESDVNDAPWTLQGPSSFNTAPNAEVDGDCGFIVRIESTNARRKFRCNCRMTWVDEELLEEDPPFGEAEFQLTMDTEAGLPTQTPEVVWTTHAPAAVRYLSFEVLADAGDIEEWIEGTGWVAVEEPLEIRATMLRVFARVRVGQRWGFPGFTTFDEEEEEFVTSDKRYSRAEFEIDWSIDGDMADEGDCGVDAAGDLDFLGEVETDWRGRITESITTDTIAINSIDEDVDADSDRHPDARHRWFMPSRSYVLERFPLGGEADTETEQDQPPQHEGDGPYTEGVHIKRDQTGGWGEVISRTTLTLEVVPADPGWDPEDGPEPRFSDWVTPDWPASGQVLTFENLRYIAAS